ncbi:hypothetical protein ACWFRB_06415 [Rhodococcus sp. NPDC055112]
MNKNPLRAAFVAAVALPVLAAVSVGPASASDFRTEAGFGELYVHVVFSTPENLGCKVTPHLFGANVNYPAEYLYNNAGQGAYGTITFRGLKAGYYDISVYCWSLVTNAVVVDEVHINEVYDVSTFPF